RSLDLLRMLLNPAAPSKYLLAEGNVSGAGSPPYPEGVAFSSPGQRPGNKGLHSARQSPERAQETAPTGAVVPFQGGAASSGPTPRALPWAGECHPFGVRGRSPAPREEIVPL